MRRRNLETGEPATLDASSRTNNRNRLAFLERSSFTRQEVRTLHYERNLLNDIPRIELPEGFLLCSVSEEEQAESLAAFHRAAFGTDQMTLEYRLAMMRVPCFDPSLDLFISGCNIWLMCWVSKLSQKNSGSQRLLSDKPREGRKIDQYRSLPEYIAESSPRGRL